MTNSGKTLADEVRKLYGHEPRKARDEIEAYLLDTYGDLSPSERLKKLRGLMAQFEGPPSGGAVASEVEEEVLSRVFSLLLGKKVTHADLSSKELLNRLAGSMNTIFDSLNQLVDVINGHLYGKSDGEETIRQVIGINMIGQGQGTPLEEYLGQIKRAFLVAQEGFRAAVRVMVLRILSELDPEGLGDMPGGGFKFGPLKKAEYYSHFLDKYENIKKWFDSERYLDDFLREFEKACEKKLTQ